MQIKRFIACALLYLLIVGGLTYVFNDASYELVIKFNLFGHDVDHALNLPVAAWVILPAAILMIFCVLHMAYHGFKFYSFKRRIARDESLYKALSKEIFLGLDTNKEFKTQIYALPSKLARILSPWDRYKDAVTNDEELDSVIAIIRDVKNGEVADLKKFKLPNNNPLFIKNELNKIEKSEDYFLEVLKKYSKITDEISRKAYKKLIKFGSFTDIKKFGFDKSGDDTLALIDRFAKGELNLNNDDVSGLLNLSDLTNDKFNTCAIMLKSKISPDALINIFERLKNHNQEAMEAYIYLLFEFEMLERAQEVLANCEQSEYPNFRILLYLRQNGKNAPTSLFFR